MTDDTEARAIAARLTNVQSQILALLPTAYGNDVFRTKGKCGVGHADVWEVCCELRADGLVDLDESEMPIFSNRSMGIGWASVTDLGLRVRAALMEMEGQHGK